ncbi:FIG00653133: hypothetical protein [hydrothermal vent metagenome]|uniref:Adenylosuccinate lyase n=1 Tax=hydrothermal vent metagenome TaxID=652676 RepID=A0A3B0TFE6_9ZZZZ
MNKEQLYSMLDCVDHSRKKRAEMAVLVSNSPKLVEPLLKIAFDVDDPISSKACWVLEFTAKNNLPYIFPNLTSFTLRLGTLHLDSSVRPMAKICEFLIKAYFQKKGYHLQMVLTDEHLELITTACFDWLIGDFKVASKAYSMTSLLLLGRKFDWIHPELKIILEQNYSTGSPAYKARARMTLEKLN